MNIGIVTTWFERGAAYVSRQYMDVLSEQHQVFIYARGGDWKGQGDPKWDQPYVTWGKSKLAKRVTWVDIPDFERWIERNQIDLVLFNEQWSWEVIVWCRRKHNVALAAYIDYYTPETVPFFNLYDCLICNTRRHHSVFHERHPRAHYVPWGTDIQVFKPRPTTPSEEVRFFHSCGIDPYRKGTMEALRAFTRVPSPARFIIHTQRPLPNEEFNRLVASDSRIELITREVTAPGLYYLGDVYVYPSHLEGIGLTMAEAIASGLPLITTDNGPMNEFVAPESAGRLVAVRDHFRREDDYYWDEVNLNEDSLVEAMTYYVEHRQDLPEMKLQARNYAETNLDWRKNARPLFEIADLAHADFLARKTSPAPDPLQSLGAAALHYEKKMSLPPWQQAAIRMGLGKLRKKVLHLAGRSPS